MKKYLLNVKFCAGSDEPEDVDQGLFLLSVEEKLTENKVKEIFKEVNKLLDTFNDSSDFPLSYDTGLNIQTLMEGVEIYTKGKVVELKNNCGELKHINNFYFVEQWQ